MVRNICDLGGLQGGNFINRSLKKTTGTLLRKFPENQRIAETRNRSSAQAVYEIRQRMIFVKFQMPYMAFRNLFVHKLH